MSKLLDYALVGIASAAIVVGSYTAGKHRERSWWRESIAAANKDVETLIKKLGDDSEELDVQLVKVIGGSYEALQKAQGAIESANTSSPAPPSDSACAPVPARCLRR